MNLLTAAQQGSQNNQNHCYVSPVSAMVSERILTAYLRHETRRNLTLHPSRYHSLPPPMPGHTYTLYVHIPFCESLCPYCSFNRFIYQQQKAEQYFEALRAEMHAVANLGYSFSSMYIGGGTPTIHISELVKTIDLAKELFPITEVSCETNPNHLTPAIIGQIEGRVQRLSVGVQSFDDGLLKQMNRYQKFGSGDEILQRISEAAPHFLSLNVDMIFNFPGQTPEILRQDLHKIIASGTQQTTFYPLMSSPSVERTMRRTMGKVNATREWSYYNIINDELHDQFQPLSSWTFARGSASMIDEYIASGEEYVGVGSGAFSYLNGTLYVNTFSLQEYTSAIMRGGFGVSAQQEYGALPQLRYALMMALFGRSVEPRSLLHFGKSGKPVLWLELSYLKLSGAFRSKTLTRFGRYLSVVMMREFFSGVNNVRDIARKALSPEELKCALPEKYAGMREYCSVPLLKS